MPQEMYLSSPAPPPDAIGRVVWAYEALCQLYLEDTGRFPWANPWAQACQLHCHPGTGLGKVP